MKKVKKIILGMLIILVSAIFVFNFSVKADSGFDGGYDGGGSSGSDWSYSSSSSSSSGGSESDSNVVTIFLIIWSIIFIICICYNVLPMFGFFKNKMSDEKIKKLLGDDFDIDAFYKEVFKIYYDTQIAWMNNDIDSVRNILSDELYNMYKMQLATLTASGRKNMMEDIKLVDVYITDIKFEGYKQLINVALNVTCRDYIVDVSDNKVVRGNKNIINDYYYDLTFMRAQNNVLEKCPNCGAKLDDAHSTVCPYCNSTINRETSKFVLIDKKMDRQGVK